MAPRADGERLEDDQGDAHDTERNDEDPEECDHPRHRPPASLVAYEPHQELDHVGDGSETRVGDREGTRDVGGEMEMVPCPPTDEARHGVLQPVVAEHVRLTHQQRKLRGQLGATLNDEFEKVGAT